MTFVRPTLSELVERARADIDSRMPGADSRLRRNALDTLALVHAGALHSVYRMTSERGGSGRVAPRRRSAATCNGVLLIHLSETLD